MDVLQKQRWQVHPNLAEMLRQNDPILGQQPADLIAELCAAADQPAADAMECLQVLLLDRFLRHESHLWAAHGFADRRRVSGIILLSL